MSKFARNLLREWRRLGLVTANGTIVVAVSGGADSVALLLALDQLVQLNKLGIKIVVAHLNHKLRGKNGDADARWVKSLAKKLGHATVVSTANVPRRAAATRDNIEQTARRARYEFLEKAARARKANVVVTAHTLDDQAETILLNLLRGSGADGLAGMAPVRQLSSRSRISLARPLLSWAKRADTESFCRERSIGFRSDEMNLDESLARVRVRRQLLPLMESFNPKIVESLARASAILREDSEALGSAAARLLKLAVETTNTRLKSGSAVRIDLLRFAPAALRRRALRLWLEQLRGDLRRLERAHVLAIENLLLSTKSGRFVELPDKTKVYRQGGLMHYQGRRAPLRARTRERRPAY